MARKRGGLAGIWDRNKKIIKPLATGIAGALTGGAGAAVLGGLMSGLDREGKKGIGFDIGQGARGAIAGYGTGMAGAGVKGLLTGGTAGAKAALSNYNRLPFGLGGSETAGVGPLAPQQAVGQGGGFFPGTGGAGVNPMDALRGTAPSAKSFGSRALGFARENKDLIGMAAKGIQSAMPDPANEAAFMNAETQRLRFEEEARQNKMDDERRRRIAELLMPMVQQNYPQYFGNR